MSLLPLRRAPAAVPPIDLMAMLPLPVLILDAHGKVVQANTAAETFFNTSQATLAERGFAGLLAEQCTLVRLIAEARGLDTSFAAYDSDVVFVGGRPVRADVFVTPVQGRAGWLIVSLQVRTVAARVERQIVNQGAARSAVGVAAMLAHEIKNPLSGIRGAAQLLAQTADADGRELTDLICAEVDRVRTLVDRMDDFTDTRALPMVPENIHAVLGHVILLARQGFARRLTIRERYDPSLPAVAGNRDALVQVFLNLLKNAAEAVDPAAGEITVSTAYRQGLRVAVPGSARRVSLPLEVCIIDNGPGAPPAVADHMFDPFVSSRPSGTGLGLALVAKIVGDHGGIVEYDRVADTAQTVFRVLLPMAEAAPAGATA